MGFDERLSYKGKVRRIAFEQIFQNKKFDPAENLKIILFYKK